MAKNRKTKAPNQDNEGLKSRDLDSAVILESADPAAQDPLPGTEVEVLPAELKQELDGEIADFEWEDIEESGSSSVVPFDPLIAYLREVRRYPSLSREDEHALAVRYFKDRDIEAAYKLVKSNLWLVVKIARDYERAARSLLDLIQEGNIGLMDAVKNFDPYRGVRFPSYAVWWIRAYIVRYIISNWRLVKIGTTQAQRKLFFNLKKEKERLEREGFKPETKLLAEKLNVRESDVVEMEQRMGSPDLSVDAPLQQDSESTLLSVLQSGSVSAEDLLSQKQVKELVEKALAEFRETLNEKEGIIFGERLLGEEKATLQELADKLSLSKERIRQIENRLKDKLKKFLLERFGAELENIGVL